MGAPLYCRPQSTLRQLPPDQPTSPLLPLNISLQSRLTNQPVLHQPMSLYHRQPRSIKNPANPLTKLPVSQLTRLLANRLTKLPRNQLLPRYAF